MALGLAACGGGGSSTQAPPPPVQPEPTAYQKGLTAINAATTAAAAQAAYDAVDQTAVSGDEAAKLQTALSTRLTVLATAARVVEQKNNLMTAAGAIDTGDLSTQAKVDAARTAIAGLRGALTAAADVSAADKAPYQTALNDAVKAVDGAQDGIDTDTRRSNQMTALSGASMTLQTALAALAGGDLTQAKVDAANTALTALNGAITAAADLTDDEKAPYQREATNASAPIRTAQNTVNDDKDDAKDKADKAMVAKAMELREGISAPGGTGADTRTAMYAGTNDSEIAVTIGTGVGSTVNLEAAETIVAAHHGWEGKKYMASGTGVSGTYEAIVYSNVGEPTAGKKFSAQYSNDLDYVTVVESVITVTVDTDATDNNNNLVTPPSRVGGSDFVHKAGDVEFKLPSPNPKNEAVIDASGTFHGVSGTYYCTPGTEKCVARKADKGYQLGKLDGTTFTQAGWTFVPTSADSLLMDTPDANYESYGWWIHTDTDGTLTASAFADNKGADRETVEISALRGTATYKGGAAGKYAISNPLGSPNDAGDFTADVELTATFAVDHKITGTIDNFMGADGKSRDWSVKLNKAGIADSGSITGSADGNTVTTDNPHVGTVWTIGGEAGGTHGQWSGSLQEENDNGVPEVATGTFTAEHGLSSRMVGAFGANKE